MRTPLLYILLVFALALPAAAEPPKTAEQHFVHKVAEDVLEAVRSKQSDTAITRDLESVFNRYIDIQWVGRFVLGRHWRTANDSQKNNFITSYRAFMINSYASRLKEYSGEHYEVSKPRPLGNGKNVLTMKLFRDVGEPVLIDYKIRKSATDFKIYDLVVEGISLISTQRSEFDSVVNRKGLDFLIKALNKKAKRG